MNEYRQHFYRMQSYERLPAEDMAAVIWAIETIAYYERVIQLMSNTLREAAKKGEHDVERTNGT